MEIIGVVIGGLLAIGGGFLGQLYSSRLRRDEQIHTWDREDTGYRALVRGSLESVFVYSNECAERAAFDARKWAGPVARLANLLTPETMRALSSVQSQALATAQFEVELAYSHIMQIAGDTGLVEQLRDLDAKLTNSNELQAAEMQVLTSVRHTARPARHAVVSALLTLGVSKPDFEEKPLADVVNAFRILRDVRPWP